MKITPLDVGNHRFPSRWKGYDPGEVDIFLEMVSQEMEQIIQENQFLSEELKRKTTTLADYREKEQILKDTMITAQKVAEDMKNNMVKEAQAIVAHAELEADAIIRKAHERLISIQEEIQELKEQRIRFREEVRSVIKTHLGILESETEKPASEEEGIETNLRVMPARKKKAAE